MTTARKNILLAGLGRFVPAGVFPNGKNKELAEIEMKKAGEHGFDCTNVDLNPEDVAWSLQTVRTLLETKKWDAFLVGYGVRGTQANTVLFEGAVNASREISPQTKLMFSTAPDTIFEAIQRAFPDA